MPEKLPEEFAPTGPKLSKFPIQPAPPIKPRLFPDEARWVLRLSLLAGLTEFAVWLSLVRAPRAALLVGALRLLRPLWAWAGTRIPRAAVAFALLFAALAAGWAAPWALALPALGDLIASAMGDAITVERRAAALSWLAMGEAVGAALGVAAGVFWWALPLPASAALLCAGLLVLDLRDRGTPRSTWPLRAYLSALRTPLGAQLSLLALAAGILAAPRWTALPVWLTALLPLAGMALASRVEPRLPNAVWLPRLGALLAVVGRFWTPLGFVALGVMFSAIPAAVARGAGEMERPLISSLAWSGLIAGAALGTVL